MPQNVICWICTCQYLIYFGKLSSQREKFYINFRPFHHDDLGPWFHSPICSVWRTCMSVNKPFVDVVYSMSKSLHFQNNSHLGFQLFEVQLKQTSYIVLMYAVSWNRTQIASLTTSMNNNYVLSFINLCNNKKNSLHPD